MNVKEKLELLTNGVVQEKGVVVRIDFAAHVDDYVRVRDGARHVYGLATGVTDKRLYIDVGEPQQESPNLSIHHDDISDITFVSLSKFALILNALR